jgi:hypothetical protein
MAGYARLFNVEMDPHKDFNGAGLFLWVGVPALEVLEKYSETLKKYPNPPAANLTKFLTFALFLLYAENAREARSKSRNKSLGFSPCHCHKQWKNK